MEALKSAKSCAAKLKGNGWEPKVWENLGWHWKVEMVAHSGCLTVDLDKSTGYHAMLSSSGGPGCDMDWYDSKRFNDPNKAVAHRIRLARKHVNGLNKVIMSLEGQLPPTP